MKPLYLSAIALLFLQTQIFAQAETQNPNSASGLYWRVKGNSGTDTAQNFLGTTDANYLTFRTNNIRRMTIDTGGRVGIGTTQPSLSGMLEITNTINTNPGVILSQYGSPNEMWFRRAQGTISAPAIVGTNGSLGRIDGRGYDGSTYLQATRIEMLVDSASASGLMTGRLAFFTAPAGATPAERMRINRNGLVGINTTAPLTRLDINGDIALRQASLTLANGANHNVVINPHPSGYSYYRITGPTTAYSITGFTAAGATDGRVLIIQNATTQILTLTDQSTLSTTSNRIMTGGGTLVVGDSGTVTLIYSVGDNRWHVQSYANAVLSGGTFANASWNTVGNAGLSNAVNFLGTTDNADVIIKRQNEEAFRAYPGGALVGVGNTSTGVVPVSGFGTRLMWAPAKNAFRAGNVNGTQWDDANVGIGSAAFGANNTASGTNSFAAGNGNTVSGQNSMVIGNGNTVTATHALVSGNGNNAAGNFSVVFNNTASSTAAATTSMAGGFQSQTQANLSIAIGWADTAKGVASVALGGFSNEARADYSFSTGNNNLSSGTQAATFGNNNTASGTNSFATGSSTNATATNTATFGAGNTASGSNAFAAGNNNTASAAQAVAFGDGNTVSGFNSLAAGNSNTVSSTRSMVSGIGNNVAGENNIVTGVLNQIVTPYGHSIVVGYQDTLSGSSSAVFGFLNKATAFTTFAMGDRNVVSGQTASAFGYQNVASGVNSFVTGQQDTTLGNLSSAFGTGNRAASFNEMAIGMYGTQYTATSTTAFNATDRIFNVGIGTAANARADAFTILKGGNVRVRGLATGGAFITAPSAITDKLVFADASGDLRAIANGSSGQVLTINGSGIPQWSTASGNAWGLTGNSGTVDGTNFIGTTDNIPFTIRTNNQQSGRVDPLLSNTFLGYWAGRDFSTGTQNTSIGTNALLLNTSGARNTAVGTSALENTNGGSGNTAVGYAALQSNTTASNSTAVGFEALLSNTTATANTAVGARALRSVVASPGNANTAMGKDALMTLTTGTDNVAIGNLAMTVANSNYNVAVGGQTMEDQLTGNWNVAVGFAALNSATSSVNNTALGAHALNNNLTGTRLVSVGSFSLFNNTASHNTAVGDSVMLLNTSGTSNVAIGNSVLRNNVTSSFNVAVGREALYNSVSGSNSAVGYRAGYGNTSGTRNSLFGDSADVTANNLTNASAIGWNARVAQSNSMVLGSIQGLNGATNTVRVGIGTNAPARGLHIGNDTIGVRYEGVSAGGSFISTPSATTDKILYADDAGDLRAMTGGSTGDVLTYTATGPAWSAATGSAWNLTGNSGTVDGTNFIGTIDSVPFNIRVNNQRAGKIDLIRHSVIFGHMAGNANTTAQLNVLVGDSAGFSMTTGFRNTLVGNRAGRSIIDGIQNTFVGNHAGVNTTGSNNTFVGSRAGFNTTTAGANTFMGESSGANNTTGAFNSFYGQASGANNTTGSSNTFIGRDAGAFTNTGLSNAFVGFEAGRNNTTGESNAFFGENAGRINTTGSYNTALGDSATVSAVNLTNATAVGAKAMAGNSNVLILGSINGINNATASVKVGIGTTNPPTKLTIYDPDNVNVTLRVASVSTAYEPALELMRTGTGGEWKIRTNTTGQMAFSRSPDDFVTNVDYYEMTATSFRPAIDDNNSLGEAGARWATVFATNGTINTSDVRDKQNILPLNYGLKEIMKLNPVTYSWKENPQWGRKIGFIAQEVQPVLSEVVQVGNQKHKTPVLDDNGKPVAPSDKLGIYYSDIIPVTVKAIQEQQQMIDEVKKENADLKNQLQLLKERIEMMEKK